MIFLNKIVTKQGDGGKTLLNNKKVPKDNPWIQLIGEIDELNSTLGLCRLFILNDQLKELINNIQNDLFDIGSVLYKAGEEQLAIYYIERLEKVIEERNKDLKPLLSFVIPGGSPANGFLNLARSVCRRSERTACGIYKIPENVRIYLNRLSDLLFIIGRIVDGEEALWKPKNEWEPK